MKRRKTQPAFATLATQQFAWVLGYLVFGVFVLKCIRCIL